LLIDRKGQRHTTTRPETPAPPLHCPACAGKLRYHETVYGWIRAAERWDYYTCRTCGRFEYRHRTGELKPVATPA
jgi:hypothetical protein